MLLRFLNIKPGEVRPVGILSGYYFLIIGAIITGKTARDTLFLNRYGKEDLPIAIIAAAVVLVLAVAIFKTLQSKFSVWSLTQGIHTVIAASYVLLALDLSRTAVFALYIVTEVAISLMIIQFWINAGSVFYSSQAKRLFTVIVSSGSVASLILGLGLYSLIQQAGPALLVYLSGAFALGAGLVSLRCRRFFIPDAEGGLASIRRTSTQSGYRSYLLSLVLLLVPITVCSIIIDFQFKFSTIDRFPNEADLASFFTIFYSAISLTGLSVQFLIAGRVFKHFGIVAGLLMLPIAVLGGSVTFFLWPVFTAIFILKVVEEVFKFTFSDTAVQLLWLPLPASVKQSNKPLIDGVVKTLLKASGGAIILGLLAYAGIRELSLLTALLAIVWVFTALRITPVYKQALLKAFQNHHLSLDEIQLEAADETMLQGVQDALSSPDPGRQAMAFEFISQLGPKHWKPHLQGILPGLHPEVQPIALEVLAGHPDILTSEELVELSRADGPLPEAAGYYAARRGVQAVIPHLEAKLNAENASLETKINTAASLCYVTNLNHPEAMATMLQMLISDDPQIVAMTIRRSEPIAAIVNDTDLIAYLNRTEPEVREAALSVAGTRHEEKFIEPILENLADNRTYAAARKALSLYPFALQFEALKRTFHSSDSPDLKTNIVNYCRELNNPEAAQFLSEVLDPYADHTPAAADSIFHLAKTARFNKATSTNLNKAKLEIIERMYRLRFVADSIGHKAPLLADTVDYLERKLRESLLKLCFIEMPETPVHTILYDISSDNEVTRGKAQDILDGALSMNERPVVLPIVYGKQWKQIETIGREILTDTSDIIAHEALNATSGQDSWTALLFLDFVLQTDRRELLNKIDWDYLKKYAQSPTWQEWAASESISKLAGHWPQLAALIDFLTKGYQREDKRMYSTLERTLLLKTVELFQGIPSADVAKLAQIAREEELLAGQKLFEAGDEGDSMYIIMSGKIRIHNDRVDIATLSSGDFLGEMALLDREPRSAAATADVESVVLVIEQEVFYEVMASRKEILQGIVRMLTRRLRGELARHSAS